MRLWSRLWLGNRVRLDAIYRSIVSSIGDDQVSMGCMGPGSSSGCKTGAIVGFVALGWSHRLVAKLSGSTHHPVTVHPWSNVEEAALLCDTPRRTSRYERQASVQRSSETRKTQMKPRLALQHTLIILRTAWITAPHSRCQCSYSCGLGPCVKTQTGGGPAGQGRTVCEVPTEANLMPSSS